MTDAPPAPAGPARAGTAPRGDGKPQMVDVFGDDASHAAAASNPVGAGIARLADADDRVVALSADMSAILAELRQRHPERYFEFGIAETNTVSVAAGMAAAGLRPYVVSMGPFGAIKCAEQLRTDVAYNHLPVRLVGRLTGLAMGFFGTSHHAIEDIAIARTMPNMTIVAPADANAVLSLMRSTAGIDGPAYIRISEGSRPVYDTAPVFERGRWLHLRHGSDVSLVGHGMGVGLAMAAAAELASGGIEADVYDAAYLKPFDEEAIIVTARATGRVVTVEDHSEIGGLASIVAEVAGRRRLGTELASVALPDTDLEVGVPAEPAGAGRRLR
jgi:transketolase